MQPSPRGGGCFFGMAGEAAGDSVRIGRERGIGRRLGGLI